MKKAISVILAVLMCLCITGCSGSSLPVFYQNTALKYIEGVGKIQFEEAKAMAENSGFRYSVNNDWIEIYEGDIYGPSISVFFKENNNPVISSVIYDNYSQEKSFYISDGLMSTTEKSKEKYVDSLADCELFMFGKTSGVDYEVKKRGSSSGSSSQSSIGSKPSSGNSSYFGVSLRFGKLLSKNVTGTTLVIKAKIEPSYSNKATVDQNYYNIEDIIKKQGGDRFTEIQYWAVADMTDGSEQKVISFTVSESTIKKIANDKIVANQMGNYVDDLFIHASLR